MTTPIDLSQLAAPDIVEALDFETILSAMVADLQARHPDFDATVESDPAYKVLEVAAYRELLIRQRVNDAARRMMLAYATGTDLDHLAALYGVERLLLDAGDPAAVPPVAPTWESDTALLRRVQLAPEALSVAGPEGAYLFHALSASAEVKDISVQSPTPGDVLITVLSTLGDGTPDAALVAAVDAALSADDVRPLTDQVTVQAATVVPYTVGATLYFYPGPDPEVVRQAAEDAVAAYVAEHHAMGHDIPLSGLYAALHQPGVQRVELTQPAVSLVVAADEAAYCTAITVTNGGTDE